MIGTQNKHRKLDYLFSLVPQFASSISRQYHNESKISDFTVYKNTPIDQWPDSWKKVYYKAYPRLKQVILPKATKISDSLSNLLSKRISTRKFSTNPISLQAFSNILYYSAGMKKHSNNSETEKRFYPSAGARYPLEIYPIILNVEGITNSIYHYHLKTHSLETLLSTKVKSRIIKQFNQPWISGSAVIFVITAIFGRTQLKYGERGYRHIITEYGHMAQNTYLTSTAEGIGCCSIGGFNDDGINSLLELNGIDEGVIGVLVIGDPEG